MNMHGATFLNSFLLSKEKTPPYTVRMRQCNFQLEQGLSTILLGIALR
jgi:hypothetical protein